MGMAHQSSKDKRGRRGLRHDAARQRARDKERAKKGATCGHKSRSRVHITRVPLTVAPPYAYEDVSDARYASKSASLTASAVSRVGSAAIMVMRKRSGSVWSQVSFTLECCSAEVSRSRAWNAGGTCVHRSCTAVAKPSWTAPSHHHQRRLHRQPMSS